MRVEIWKEYPIEAEFEGFYRIEVSSEGRVKTYSKMYPEGKIVRGSVQGGYYCLRSKLRGKWSDKDLKKIQDINDEINQLNIQIKELKSKLDQKDHLVLLRAQRDELIQKRKKVNNKLTNKNTVNLSILFHKAVAELFLEPNTDPEKKFVIHKDFDKTNNVSINLEWASQEDINARVMKHPKMMLWEFKKQFVDETIKVKTSKLSELQVLTIKRRLKRGHSVKKLAKQFGVSDMQIHRIKTGENWSHVKLLEDIQNEKK